jgi:DNA-binding ferritin-like protein
MDSVIEKMDDLTKIAEALGYNPNGVVRNVLKKTEELKNKEREIKERDAIIHELQKHIKSFGRKHERYINRINKSNSLDFEE